MKLRPCPIPDKFKYSCSITKDASFGLVGWNGFWTLSKTGADVEVAATGPSVLCSVVIGTGSRKLLDIPAILRAASDLEHGSPRPGDEASGGLRTKHGPHFHSSATFYLDKLRCFGVGI